MQLGVSDAEKQVVKASHTPIFFLISCFNLRLHFLTILNIVQDKETEQNNVYPQWIYGGALEHTD